eukprot:Colp12_sorted_trinity150504_noHs@27325
MDGQLVALSSKNNGVVLGHSHSLGTTQHAGLEFLEGQTNLLAQKLGTSENGHILESGLAVVTEARGLDGSNVGSATDLVEDQSGEGLPFDILSDNEQGLRVLGGKLKGRHHIGHLADLALHEKNVRVFKLSAASLSVGSKVGGDVATVKLHALSGLKFVVEGRAVLDSDGTVTADLLHSSGDELADLVVSIGRDGGHLLNLLGGVDHHRAGLEVLQHNINSCLDASTQVGRANASLHVLACLSVHSTCEDGGSGGTVTSLIVGLTGNILDQASTKVLELILELDVLGNSHTVLGDLGGAVSLLDHDRATLGAESHSHCISKLVHTGKHSNTGLITVLNLVGIATDGSAGTHAKSGAGRCLSSKTEHFLLH